MGFGSDQARQLDPQPWTSQTTTRPPAWLEPFIRQGMGVSGQIFNDRLGGAGAPPTFEDVMSGAFQSSYGGPRPEYGLDLEAGSLEAESLGRPGPARGEGDGGDVGGIPATPYARGGRGDPATGGRRPPRGSAAGGGAGGGRRRPGGASDPLGGMRSQVAEIMLGGAAQPSPSLGAGTDFITQLLTSASNPMLDTAAQQQQETYADTRDPSSAINQLINRQMSQGNPAAGHQTNFIDQLFGRFNAPAEPPGPGRYDLMGAFGESDPLFDFWGGGG